MSELNTYQKLLGLHGFLLVSDMNYVEGRFLLYHDSFLGGGILLWLAIEQIMKIHMIHEGLKNNNLSDYQFDSSKYIRSNGSPDVKNLQHKFSKIMKNINHHHELHKFIRDFEIQTDVSISQFRSSLEVIHGLFHRRYHEPLKEIKIGKFRTNSLLDNCDQIYFLIRSKFSHLMNRSTIDDIFYREFMHEKQPYFSYNYLLRKNKYAEPRQYFPRLESVNSVMMCTNGVYIWPPDNSSDRILLKEFKLQSH